MFVHEGCEVGIKVLNELDASKVMVNARIKNRTAGTVDGWRDVLGNWFVTPEGGDKPVPVEVQVVERMMLVQREQLGGHHDYGNIRSSRGLLQLSVGLGFLTKDEMEVATKSDGAELNSSDITEEAAKFKKEVAQLEHENKQIKDQVAKLNEEKVKLKKEVAHFNDEKEQFKGKIIKLKAEVAKLKELRKPKFHSYLRLPKANWEPRYFQSKQLQYRKKGQECRALLTFPLINFWP